MSLIISAILFPRHEQSCMQVKSQVFIHSLHITDSCSFLLLLPSSPLLLHCDVDTYTYLILYTTGRVPFLLVPSTSVITLHVPQIHVFSSVEWMSHLVSSFLVLASVLFTVASMILGCISAPSVEWFPQTASHSNMHRFLPWSQATWSVFPTLVKCVIQN